jgi:hypothetical protein
VVTTPSPTRKLPPLTSATSLQATKSMKIMKNLTDISVKSDLRDYLDWLNTNYGISKASSIFLHVTTPSISHKYSMDKIKHDFVE